MHLYNAISFFCSTHLYAANTMSYDEYLTCGPESNLVASVKGNGGLPATKLIHPGGSEALIYHHGATVTSFKAAKSREGKFVAKFAHPCVTRTMLASPQFFSCLQKLSLMAKSPFVAAFPSSSRRFGRMRPLVCVDKFPKQCPSDW